MQLENLKSTVMLLGLSAALVWGRAARAEDPNAILDLLEHKGLITHEEARQARKYYDQQQREAIVKSGKTKVASWIDQMKWYGDFRLRSDYQSFEADLNLPDRLRWRMRLRVGAEMKVQDWADIGFRLATGEASPGNAVSANTTFTSEFTKKPINVDLAYATIHPAVVEWMSVTGGKINPPVWAPPFNSPLTYDPDLTVEGAGENFAWALGDRGQYKVFLNGGQYVLAEFSGNSNDAYMFDQQAGFQARFAPLTITVAGGYYLTHNLQNVATNADLSCNTGNTITNGTYLGNFNDWYGVGELVWQIRPEPFLGTPAVLKFSGEYLKNVSSVFVNNPLGDATRGWTGQISFGDAARKGQWLVAYQYKQLEANSTLDAITDDDFSAGGTDRRGHVIKAAYNLLDWWQLGFTSYITGKIDAQRTGANAQPGVQGQTRLHVMADSMFRF
ncbi:MAG TPA: putative porin [Verrucomicrobiae bacterium]|nr:putative porin [Verrucomicrobiae bacterium]